MHTHRLTHIKGERERTRTNIQTSFIFFQEQEHVRGSNDTKNGHAIDITSLCAHIYFLIPWQRRSSENSKSIERKKNRKHLQEFMHLFIFFKSF